MANNAVAPPEPPQHRAGPGAGTGPGSVAETRIANAPPDIALVGVVIAVTRCEPSVLAIRANLNGSPQAALPSLPFEPCGSGNLEAVLREGITRATAVELGYVEQLSTELTAPPSIHDHPANASSRRLTINYLALALGSEAPPASSPARRSATWLPLYNLLPWEDWRQGRPAIIANAIEPKLKTWVDAGAGDTQARHDRAQLCFGTFQGGWDEEKVEERLQLLRDAGILGSLQLDQDGRRAQHQRQTAGAPSIARMDGDIGTIAHALGRLRSKIKIKPIVFELVPDQFTLYELQQTVEAILGPPLHKQNFRRLVEHMGLVEPTGEIKSHTGGRPAQLFRFRPSVVMEKFHPGLRVRSPRL